MDKKYIGQKISDIRKERGMTQKELAAKLHVTDKTVSKWETGTHFPDISIMEDLARALGITVTDLLGLEKATTEQTIDTMTAISIEEKNEIKKSIRTNSLLNVICVIYLMFAEVYLYLQLVKIGLNDSTYSVFTIGLMGMMGTILGGSLYSFVNAKKL